MARLAYLHLSDTSRYPINKVRVSASYKNISRKQLEQIFSSYLHNQSYFTLDSHALESELNQFPWLQSAQVKKEWPDALKIILIEKKPVAIWNHHPMTATGEILPGVIKKGTSELPQLFGPENQQIDVLHIYKKLSKLLASVGLSAQSLRLRENQAWEMMLENGVKIQLGKQNLERRLQRFCQVYPVISTDKPEQLSSVDLRYARGMAVQRKQPMGR